MSIWNVNFIPKIKFKCGLKLQWLFKLKLATVGHHRAATPHINSQTNTPPPNYQCCLLAQASVLLLLQYAATLGRGRDLIYFWKVGHLFPKSGLRIDLVSIIYVRYCGLLKITVTTNLKSMFIFFFQTKTENL